MSGLLASARAELLRLRRWPAFWVLIGVWFALDLAFVYVFNYIAYRTGSGSGMADGVPRAQLLADLMPGAVPVAAVQGTPLFGGAILLILGALTVGSGFGWGTWKTVLTQGPGRGTAFGGTLVVLALTVVALVLATFALDLGVSSVLALVESQPVALPSIGELARGAGTGSLVLGMWASAGVLIGVLTRSPALAVGLGLVWALVVENLLRGVSTLISGLAVVTDHLPGTAAGSLVGALGAVGGAQPGAADSTPGVQTILTGGTAAGFLVGYLALFAAAGLALLRRRDLA
jgi:ABC-2 type transport system permease protein